jgi:hypothetical protein
MAGICPESCSQEVPSFNGGGCAQAWVELRTDKRKEGLEKLDSRFIIANRAKA